MALPNIPDKFQYLPETSLQGPFIAAGFKSQLIYCGAYAIINCSLACDQNTILYVYQSPSDNDLEETLLYKTSITANNYFFKRFQIKGAYFSIELENPGSVTGKVNLITSVSANMNFAASTFLNSKMTIDDDTSLVREGNSYHNDLIRGLHFDFKKVNIQGIVSNKTSTIPATEFTVGLPSNFTFNSTGVATNIVVSGANDNFPAGTGARQIRLTGLLDDNTPFDSIYDVNTGTGGLGLNVISIDRMIVDNAGSLNHNEGLIQIQESGSGQVLGQVLATENVSHAAVYRVPINKELILREINIVAVSTGGTIRVIEKDNTKNLEYSLGDFRINTTNTQLTYDLDGLIPSNNTVKINYIPDVGAPAGDVLINVNINAVLCPLVNNFPNNSF